MAGGDSPNAKNLTGLAKIFNGETMRGRANVALATYCTIGLVIAYFSLRPKKNK